MKKLFSYLLISSMVVLSSCTNYDDQFDDLNTQINSLKGQIEGFSSLSSGLTALQGTVASLQTAIANIPVTPATDISGLESTQAALQTALTALATEVTALQTSLAAADTSADVDALTLALAQVKTDLAELLASNNVYTPANGSALSIATAAELAFAKSLGNKLGIINGALTVTQSTSMDATELAAVLAKIKTVTGLITFTAKATGITQTAGFTNLSSAGDLTLDVDGPISLPMLKSTATMIVNDHTKLTSFSAPKLETVTTINNGSANGTLTVAKATSVNLASLIRYTGALTIVQKSGLVDLSALGNTNVTAGGLETTETLTLTGATSFSLPVRTAGIIIADQVTAAVSLPVWKGKTGSSFDKASEVVLPSITGGVAINLNTWAAKATKFHYIGTGLKASATVTNYPTFTTGAVNNSNLETLIIDGTSTSVNISDAIDLTSLTFTGAANTVILNDLESMTDITLGYVSKIGSYSSGTLAVTSNEKLESLTADSLDDISSLDISGNENLATISFDALNSLGTSSAGAAIAAANINITGNDFTASNIQLPSDSDDAVAVTAAITTASGLNDLEVYAGLAAALSTTEVFVIDHVEKVTKKDGSTPASVSASEWSATSASKGFAWGGADQSVIIMSAGTAASTDGVNPRYQTATAGLNAAIFTTGTTNTTDLANTDNISIRPRGTNLATVTTTDAFTASISGFDATNPSTYALAIATELNRQLDEGGHPYHVTIANDFGENYTYNVEATINTTGAAVNVSSILLASDQVLFSFGGVNLTAPVTSSVAQGANEALEAGVVHAINNGSLSKTYRAQIESSQIKVTPLTNQGANDNLFANSTTNPALRWSAYNPTTSNVYALKVSEVINTTSNKLNRGWRITVKNESLTVKADDLEAGGDNVFATGTLTNTLTNNINVSDVGTALSNTNVLVEWSGVLNGSDPSQAAVAGYSLVSWF